MTTADAPLTDIESGDYQVAAAYLVSPHSQKATQVQDAVIHMAERNGRSHIASGWGQVCISHIIDMLEDDEQLDLIIDMGAGHHLMMVNPTIRSGKVFQANTVSTFHFQPIQSVRFLTEDQYRQKVVALQLR